MLQQLLVISIFHKSLYTQLLVRIACFSFCFKIGLAVQVEKSLSSVSTKCFENAELVSSLAIFFTLQVVFDLPT